MAVLCNISIFLKKLVIEAQRLCIRRSFSDLRPKVRVSTLISLFRLILLNFGCSTESAGLVTLISQSIQATPSFSLPSRKDSNTPVTGETYAQPSGRMYSLSTPAHQGLQSSSPVSIPATAHNPLLGDRTTLMKTTSSRNFFSKKLHTRVDPSSTPHGRFVTEIHVYTSFQGPQSSSPMSTTFSTIVGTYEDNNSFKITAECTKGSDMARITIFLTSCYKCSGN